MGAETTRRQHTGVDYLLDADEVVTNGLHTGIDVVSTADHSLEVLRRLGASLDGGVKVEVGDEDDATLEHKAGRKKRTVIISHPSLGTPEDPAAVGGVARRLEQVEGVGVKEHAVAVVKHDDVTGLAVAVQGLVETGGAHEPLDDAGTFPRRVVVLERALYRKGLAEPGGAGDDQCSRVTATCRLSHDVDDVEACT